MATKRLGIAVLFALATFVTMEAKATDFVVLGDSIALGNPYCGYLYSDPALVQQMATHSQDYNPYTNQLVPTNLTVPFLRVGLSLVPYYFGFLGQDVRVLKTAADATTTVQWDQDRIDQTLALAHSLAMNPQYFITNLGTNDLIFNVPESDSDLAIHAIDHAIQVSFPEALRIYVKISRNGQMYDVYPGKLEHINTTFDLLDEQNPQVVAIDDIAELSSDRIHPSCLGEVQQAIKIIETLQEL